MKKLVDRSEPIYFGIEDDSKAHRMYNPQSNKVVVSRDIVFEETVKWRWDATETDDFSVEVENGQFFPQIVTTGVVDGNVHDDHQLSDSGGAHSGEQH